jgi:hypothetical protein
MPEELAINIYCDNRTILIMTTDELAKLIVNSTIFFDKLHDCKVYIFELQSPEI